MATRPKTRTGEAPRLDANAWTAVALEALAQNGIDGVRVELLAKQLSVTKGSFYWHFKDRDALHESMLNHWRRKATLSLIERLDKAGTLPEARLRQLLKLPLLGARSAKAADVELAIRLWGRRDARAQAALEEVDSLRLRYIAKLLSECGLDAEEAEARSILAYCYLRVAVTLIRPQAKALMMRCENLLLGIEISTEADSGPISATT